MVASSAAFSTATVGTGATGKDAASRLGLMVERTFEWFGDLFGSIVCFNFSEPDSSLTNPFGWNTPTEGEVNAVLGAQVFTMASVPSW